MAPEPNVNDNVASGPDGLAAHFGRELSLASRAVHADDYINNHQAVAPPMHVSTTFRYSENPDELIPERMNVTPNAPYDSHIYSRHTAPNTTRLEALLGSLLGAPCVTYTSGLAAFHAMIVYLNPRRVAIGGGYHGCHGVLRVVRKLTGVQQLTLAEEDLAQLQPGDVLHVETPLNPTGEARDLAHYRRVADERGCFLTVDATFAPPPLQDPFAFGADIVMHSGTKYIGGHSDMLCGVLAVRRDHDVPTAAAAAGGHGDDDNDTALSPTGTNWVAGLKAERLYLGNVMGSLEGWLGVRSLRTLELRVMRQSANAEHLVAWLAGAVALRGTASEKLVESVQHASLQPEAADPDSWLRKQMPVGFGPVFSVLMRSADDARRLPSGLRLFHHATSLGGVESLIEWRAMTDNTVDKRLLRISVGVEAWEDLRDDLARGLDELAAAPRKTAE